MIQLDYRDSRPLHRQVRDGFAQLLLRGVIAPGEKLPSVRTLATRLSINPNTIQRAYEALEAEGYVYSQPGRGTFAADTAARSESRRRELREQLLQTAAELETLGIARETLCDWLQAAEKKEETP